MTATEARSVTFETTAAAFFADLSNSMQRYHVDNVNAAKNADTRQRRIEKGRHVVPRAQAAMR